MIHQLDNDTEPAPRDVGAGDTIYTPTSSDFNLQGTEPEGPEPATTDSPKLQRVKEQPENPFSKLIPDQEICVIPSFTLESGVTLQNVPIAYTTRGKLAADGKNAMVICHALTGSADVADWWGPLLGRDGRAFDTSRFFIVCLNSLGSPYGSASPVTYKNGNPALGHYGPEFPLTTVRDDVHVHRRVLDDLGVKQIAAVIGGSMGGMLTLEWAYFGKDYVRCIAPIATSSRHSAWCISWGEAQRQSIYCDPLYDDGYYSFDSPPASGLSAARMSALLTYRSRDSFQSRFGRNAPDPSRRQNINGSARSPSVENGEVNEHWRIHNEGHRNESPATPRTGGTPPDSSSPVLVAAPSQDAFTDPQFHGSTPLEPEPQPLPPTARRRPNTYFSAQSYLRYQGQKFVKRFDSNCYIAITRKLDTHDVSRGRLAEAASSGSLKQQAELIPEVGPNSNERNSEPPADTIHRALGLIQQPALVVGIQSDGLFTFAEQQEIAAGIPDSRLKRIESPEGHDAFLLQFEQVNNHLLEFLREVLPDIMGREGSNPAIDGDGNAKDADVGFKAQRESTFGEAEVDDITAW